MNSFARRIAPADQFKVTHARPETCQLAIQRTEQRIEELMTHRSIMQPDVPHISIFSMLEIERQVLRILKNPALLDRSQFYNGK